MARPRILRIEGGEIILKNLPKERGDEIISLISGGQGESSTKEETLEEEPTPIVTPKLNKGELKHTALGLHKNSSGSWELVSVKYNSETREAEVESVKEYRAGDRQIAIGDLKVKVAKLMM